MTDYIEYTVRECTNGDRVWRTDGKLNRFDGPAIECANGDREWWVNGDLHRLEGPAVEYANDIREWYLNGDLHRVDGPAIEYADGTREWYLNGKRLTEEDHARRTSTTEEMTLAQVCKALGKNIKIVKG